MARNVDGLVIASYPWKKQVDVAALSESPLFDDEISKDPGGNEERVALIPLAHYRVAHWRNRESTVGWRCGGLPILARTGIDCVLIPQDLSCRSVRSAVVR